MVSTAECVSPPTRMNRPAIGSPTVTELPTVAGTGWMKIRGNTVASSAVTLYTLLVASFDPHASLVELRHWLRLAQCHLACGAARDAMVQTNNAACPRLANRFSEDLGSFRQRYTDVSFTRYAKVAAARST